MVAQAEEAVGAEEKEKEAHRARSLGTPAIAKTDEIFHSKKFVSFSAVLSPLNPLGTFGFLALPVPS